MGGKTVVLGLSGGVDSAVAARLLQEQGYTVYGHWLDIGLGGREDAQQVAETFGIPFSAGDIRRELEASVMGPFQRDYLAGRTPLPCARCNPTVKFPALFRRAEETATTPPGWRPEARCRRRAILWTGPAGCWAGTGVSIAIPSVSAGGWVSRRPTGCLSRRSARRPRRWSSPTARTLWRTRSGGRTLTRWPL